MSERTQYIENMKARLDRWNVEIGKLETKVQELANDTKGQYQKQLIEMQRYRDEAQQKLTELQNASDEAWKDIRSRLDKSWSKVTQSFETAMSRFER